MISQSTPVTKQFLQSIPEAQQPTAGFHFTTEILESLKAKGVEIVEITLHIGLGTLSPLVLATQMTTKCTKKHIKLVKKLRTRLIKHSVKNDGS